MLTRVLGGTGGLGESTWLVWIKDVVLVGSSVLLLWPFLLFLRNHKGRVPFGASVWAVAPLGLAALGKGKSLFQPAQPSLLTRELGVRQCLLGRGPRGSWQLVHFSELPLWPF